MSPVADSRIPSQALQLILDACQEDALQPLDLSDKLAIIDVNFSLINFYAECFNENHEPLSWSCPKLTAWMLENFGHTNKGVLPARAICFLANQTSRLAKDWYDRYQASIPAQDRTSSTVEVQPPSQALQT